MRPGVGNEKAHELLQLGVGNEKAHALLQLSRKTGSHQISDSVWGFVTCFSCIDILQLTRNAEERSHIGLERASESSKKKNNGIQSIDTDVTQTLSQTTYVLRKNFWASVCGPRQKRSVEGQAEEQ